MGVTTKTLLISFLCLLATANVQAKDGEVPVLVYGYPDVSIWATQRDSQGELKKPLLKLAEAIFTEAGIQWTAKPYPAKRLFKHLKEGIVPFSMLVRAPVLQQCCLFSKQPVASTELRIYRRAGTIPVTTLDDFIGKRVIMIRGYSYGGIGKFIRDASNDVEVQDAASHSAAFQLFERNRGDYVIDYVGPAEEVLASKDIDNVVHDVFTQLDVFLVISRSYPNASEVLKELESIAANLLVPHITSPQ